MIQLQRLLLLPLLLIQSATFASQVTISIKNRELPASDLLRPDPSKLSDAQKLCIKDADIILSPTQALCLRNAYMDLSWLEPSPTSNIWGPAPTQTDDTALAIDSGDTVVYENTDTTAANSGRFKFNVQTAAVGAEPSQTLSIMMATNLHTYLLRKEFLRKLGYQVPAMKYLDRLTIRFKNTHDHDMFMTNIPLFASGAPTRWIVPKPVPLISDPLVVTLQDVVALEATPVIYNLAISPPVIGTGTVGQIAPENERILRSAAMMYGLADIDESLNQVEWTFGKVQNGSVVFNVFDNADFACTMDDAMWMLRRIAPLTRQDYQDMVARSFFPAPVAAVLTEKLVSRRDSILKLFNVDVPSYPFNPKVTMKPYLVNGKILTRDWPGYASMFEGVDPESPVRKMGFYALSELESNAMTNLISLANAEIPSLDQQNQTAKHQTDLANAAAQYMKSGQPQPVAIKAWAAPLVDGGLDIDRSIVMGAYLGTNNLVQLADTFGIHMNLGMMVGFDNVPTGTNISGLIQGSLSISMAHIKPIDNLKQSLTEPIQNVFVPWLFGKSSSIFKTVSRMQGNPNGLTQAAYQKELETELSYITKYLGIGESLLLTESINGLEQLSVSEGLPVPVGPSVGVTVGSNQIVLSRIQLYRKDANTIQIFKDNGQLIGVNAAFDISLGYPVPFTILNITAKANVGHAKSKIYNVNINPNPAQNPAIYAVANALSKTLLTGSVELLDTLQPHGTVETKFHDNATQIQFINLVHRTLRTNGSMDVEMADGSHGQFIYLTKGKQDGLHYQLLATQIADYLVNLSIQSAGPNAATSNFGNAFSVGLQANPNPGQSLLGKSNTRDAQYQARVLSDAPGGLSDPFVGIQYRWEGWNMKAPAMIAQTDTLSKKYGYKLYNDGYLNDTTSVKLYNLSLQINIYQTGIDTVLHMSEADQNSLVERYKKQHKCFLGLGPECAAIARFNQALNHYRKKEGSVMNEAEKTLKIISSLEQFTTFEDLCKTIGGIKNLYLYSVLDGFRTNSEMHSTPIYSNTMGSRPLLNPDGVISTEQSLLGIESGEFQMKWLRDTL